MEQELVTLAATAAAALVKAMTTDAWERLRPRLAGLFGHGNSQQIESVDAELVAAQSEVVSADAKASTEAAEEIEVEWRSRFRRLLATNPELTIELTNLFSEFDLGIPAENDSVIMSNFTFSGNTAFQGQGRQNNQFDSRQSGNQ